MNIQTSRQKLMRTLVLATALVSLLGIIVEILAGHHETRGWMVVFDLDKEWNVPTIFSAFLLFAASAVLALIAAESRRLRMRDFRHWIALSAIFLFCGTDELFSIHNSAKHLVPVWFRHIGLLNLRWDLRWVVIGIPATLVLAALFVPFVLRLPRRTACGIIIAGIIYVGAAIGVEMIGGWWIGTYTRNNWTYSCLVVVEEVGEMIGALMFLNVLLAYAEREPRGHGRLGPVTL